MSFNLHLPLNAFPETAHHIIRILQVVNGHTLNDKLSWQFLSKANELLRTHIFHRDQVFVTHLKVVQSDVYVDAVCIAFYDSLQLEVSSLRVIERVLRLDSFSFNNGSLFRSIFLAYDDDFRLRRCHDIAITIEHDACELGILVNTRARLRITIESRRQI